MNHNALGALLFGTLTLGLLGAAALLFGGPAEITAIIVATACAYVAQLCFYIGEVGGSRTTAGLGFWFWAASVLLAALSGIATVWF